MDDKICSCSPCQNSLGAIKKNKKKHATLSEQFTGCRNGHNRQP